MTSSRTLAAAAAAWVLVAATPAGAQESVPAPTPPATAPAPTTAAPDAEKSACVAGLDRAQSLEASKKLREARASYLTCSAENCPALVREDCARSLVALDAALPSVVFSALADGHDVADVRVLVDGELLTDKLDGRAFPLDPGAHVVRFERASGGARVLDMPLVVRQGEKNRLVSATFATTLPKEEEVKPEGKRPFPLLPVVFAATGVVALGGGLVLRLRADSDADDLRRSCAPSCDPSERNALSDKLVLANVALGIGLGALALSAATWIFAPSR
ncbi:MAG: hypothetical protein JWM74_1806 [Myxococcaceae bacterium]|nr:hypothetical protein [Myxococcaceae bacterium]